MTTIDPVTKEIIPRFVGFTPDATTALNNRIPGYNSMTPVERAGALRSMGHGDVGTVVSPTPQANEKGVTNFGNTTEYDPRKDLTSGKISSTEVGVNPKYVTPGASNIGTIDFSAKPAPSTERVIDETGDRTVNTPPVAANGPTVTAPKAPTVAQQTNAAQTGASANPSAAPFNAMAGTVTGEALGNVSNSPMKTAGYNTSVGDSLRTTDLHLTSPDLASSRINNSTVPPVIPPSRRLSSFSEIPNAFESAWRGATSTARSAADALSGLPAAPEAPPITTPSNRLAFEPGSRSPAPEQPSVSNIADSKSPVNSNSQFMKQPNLGANTPLPDEELQKRLKAGDLAGEDKSTLPSFAFGAA
jgi:hypothetical protein